MATTTVVQGTKQSRRSVADSQLATRAVPIEASLTPNQTRGLKLGDYKMRPETARYYTAIHVHRPRGLRHLDRCR